MSDNFNYQMQGLLCSEVTLKGKKSYFVEGYISTMDEDTANETVTLNGQKKILEACKNRIITLDIDHEEWIDQRTGKQLSKPKNQALPVAKVVDAELRAKGVWVKCEINQDCGRFETVWNNIINNFLHSFSVVFFPTKFTTKSLGGVIHKIVDDLDLVNVTFTGAPINPNATFTPVMKAATAVSIAPTPTQNQPGVADGPVVNAHTSQSQSPQGEGKPMETTTQPDPVVPTAPAAPVEPVVAAPAVATPTVEDLNKLQEQLKQEREALAAERVALLTKQNELNVAQQAHKADVEKFAGPLATIKADMAQIAVDKAEIARLKAEAVKPVFKSQLSEQPKVEIRLAKQSPLDTIR